eukprot:scaffold89414_cov45-Phaeocystis_antarctica.AAC.1
MPPHRPKTDPLLPPSPRASSALASSAGPPPVLRAVPERTPTCRRLARRAGGAAAGGGRAHEPRGQGGLRRGRPQDLLRRSGGGGVLLRPAFPSRAKPGVRRAPLGAVYLHAIARGAGAAARPLLPQHRLGHRLCLDHRGIPHRAARGAPRGGGEAPAGRARHAAGARARPRGSELPLRLSA